MILYLFDDFVSWCTKNVQNSALASGHNETGRAVWLGADGNRFRDSSHDDSNCFVPVFFLFFFYLPPCRQQRHRASDNNPIPNDTCYGVEAIRALVVRRKECKCTRHCLLLNVLAVFAKWYMEIVYTTVRWHDETRPEIRLRSYQTRLFITAE